MDFLLLLAGRQRVVIEVDGAHHYSGEGRPSPRKCSDMVAEDRALRLAGYEIYRSTATNLRLSEAEKRF